MEHRRLGRSGLYVSEITYGNWLTHGELVARDTALACIQAALDAGVTTFDTADVYAQGAAEQVLGDALRTVRRSSVEIATKVCLPTGDGPNDRGLSRKHIIESCHASLRRLGTDYVDLYQAHRFDERTPIEESLIAFDDLVRQGKVLYLGVSEWTAPQIEAALRIAADLGLRSRIVANQPQYNMLWRVIEPQVLPLCEREGIGQVVFQPLAQGVLTGKYQPGRPLPENSRATSGGRAPQFISRVLGPVLLDRVQRLRPLADEAGLTMAQLAVAWTLQPGSVSSAIIGASRPEQVTENAVAAGVRLPTDLLSKIDEVLGDLIDRDPTKTAQMMSVKPDWNRPKP
ncbi:aldo/keto reductase [Actinoplanes lobatus]|uniref:Aldo/keto reductase n=1 Tax=Actinoplanes lobatus TaxID=113568 RepID=A0A7W7HJM5_9ACTN|nr:aldo/keto reductase family protein [Actinoplanes lobatus]MBB4751752.1 aryl-alcohol dehydrogenase-like predicted oxidoreductase [Actinoplanes lobatus]GGN65593.1 aldo/keto reductase [Actinoplanes lobatus]GIE43334.1 aldo/keto reductase [Actinoplanes lobatus]